jgi:transcription antitermination factor NusG
MALWLKVKRMGMQVKTDISICGELSWWALYTRHQHEKTVAEMLSNKGFDVFLPLYDSVRRWKDRNKLLSLPLFPGYVFVRGGLSRKLQVVSTPGVHMILYRGEQAAVIPDAEIQAIRAAVNGHYRVEPHPFLKCGDQVRVIRGSLEGVEGILTRKKNYVRLVLSVEMLAQSVAVEVNASDVEPINPPQLTSLPAGRHSAASANIGRSLVPMGRPDLGLANG